LFLALCIFRLRCLEGERETLVDLISDARELTIGEAMTIHQMVRHSLCLRTFADILRATIARAPVFFFFVIISFLPL
jgi:hypothetical protein